MELTAVSFDSFRSLVDTQLDFKNKCIGLVGINESGKTNVLTGLSALSDLHKLCNTDTPKIHKNRPPYIRYHFRLSEELTKELTATLTAMYEIHTDILPQFFEVTLHKKYTHKSDNEVSWVTIDNLINVPSLHYLKDSASPHNRKISINNESQSIENVLSIKKQDITENQQLVKLSKELYELQTESEQIDENLEQESEQLLKINSKLESTINSNSQTPTLAEKELDASSECNDPDTTTPELPQNTISELELLKKEISKRHALLEKRKSALQEQIEVTEEKAKECDDWLQLANAKADKDRWENFSVPEKEQEISSLEKQLERVEKLKAQQTNDNSTTTEEIEESKKEQAKLKRNLTSSRTKLFELKSKIVEAKRQINSLEPNLQDFYSQDVSEISKQLGEIIQSDITPLIPKVVFWKYHDDYILKGETLYSEIKKKKLLSELPRPLTNIFRIGEDLHSLDEIKDFLNDISSNSGLRSTAEKRINRKVDKYLKKVWPKYDQKLNIKLERNEIVIQIYDPACTDASHFQMHERSQGCQSFLSFLFTISAEAQYGVIKNTLLLLDEPETHLHPTGVRYMLRQLIETGDQGNFVVYATHSLFMIDRDNFDRHVVVKKALENTTLEPSTRGRIGYFMHEEVLYKALQVDLSNEFSLKYKYNFVFEGDGDARLFEAFTQHCLNKEIHKYFFSKEDTFFYHGGKCSDILKHFQKMPIQLGSKWFFILDKDRPASKLKAMLESVYSEYIEKDIFIRQYSIDGTSELELENLLEEKFITETIHSTLNDTEIVQHGLPKPLTPSSLSAYINQLQEENLDEEILDLFKEKFKKQLNKSIEDTVMSVDNRKRFNTIFPTYSNWATDAVQSIWKQLTK